MFGSLGFTEIAFVLILALLLFGPKRLPEIGRTIGKGLSEFRRASNDLKRTLEREVAFDELEQRRAIPPPAAQRPVAVEPPPATVIAPAPAGPAVASPVVAAAEPAAPDPVAADDEQPG
ncbi:MAG TPA: twin-arginine translocase TatA/TatE family subunit [Thermoanaerobaculia bacterium]|nr:twin-arginine translocase TatA/TatE family subunit [Thermoanaerobaculia bacterium]